jgi:predicted GNAT family N-acyltransferase
MKDLIIKVACLPEEWIEIRTIRTLVFQWEQGVKSDLDFDGQDEFCEQFIALFDGQAVGCVRLRFLDEKTGKIERLAILPMLRKRGIAIKMMKMVLKTAQNKNLDVVMVHAQNYIKSLYIKLGFEQVGDTFDEAAIPHVKMIKNLTNSYSLIQKLH